MKINETVAKLKLSFGDTVNWNTHITERQAKQQQQLQQQQLQQQQVGMRRTVAVYLSFVIFVSFHFSRTLFIHCMPQFL
jgi:hypothetical protein